MGYDRRLDAKRHNERWKLTASLLNNLATATIVAAFVSPYFMGTQNVQSGVWLLIAGLVHLSARFTLQRLRSED